jgi:hypothetical protein
MQIKRRIDLTGQHFGRLIVLGLSHIDNHSQSCWRCQCGCGAERIVIGSSLTKGDTRSCGCLQREVAAESNTTHGMTKMPEYPMWRNMIDRCYNSRNKRFKDYGGREPPYTPITVFDLWRFGDGAKSGPELFCDYIRDNLGPKPSPRHVIDRIKDNGNYEPGNLRWATPQESSMNQRGRANSTSIYKGASLGRRLFRNSVQLPPYQPWKICL